MRDMQINCMHSQQKYQKV